ncbi:MAG: cytochrome-c oxidase, cbb3-type subunit I [Deltaproteobacteria bacterium]|nr:cytochrome-c oxidase, cbb3-type subunit I [Deltaproteobacteria bacterium]
MKTITITYDDKIVRWFLWASVIFGLVGTLAGVFIALELAWWPANAARWISFGRLRPLHTNAAIFAFVGNMIFAGVYYSTQRLTKARMASDLLSKIHFWGWQLIIVGAAITLPLGLTQGKEYAELIWPIDIAVAVIWLVFGANFFWTLAKRREKHLYVALWFYIATIVTITVLYVVNNLAVPVSMVESYPIFGGVQDALVQWWYGHNAVAFFLTTPILGIMYYFMPKAANRPIFSYRLSIIHFWGLVFLYIWAGPHHLLNTALPAWAQTVGMVFSLMLWAPSWGGMINGLLTLRGAWDKLRSDPVLKFFAAGVTFYGMATFEGPLLAIRSVNGLAHYTDWIIGHVHAGTLGWNGFMAAGMFYWLVPKLYGTKLHSRAAANYHFWIGTVGILLYVVSMWVAGITQGLMWRAEQPGGGLEYPNFIETLIVLKPLYWTRLVGGSLYVIGLIMMTWNLVKTAMNGAPAETTVEVPADDLPKNANWKDLVFGKPALVSLVVVALMLAAGFVDAIPASVLIALSVAVAIGGYYLTAKGRSDDKPTWHRLLEGRAGLFTVFTVVAMLVGGVAEIVPTVIATPEATTIQNTPYTALELEGRDIYVREGCYTCHSQMIRTFTWESARYGAVSELQDSAFDHPFQWGSRRIGPDLARIGGKYSDLWHYRHMVDPRQISEGSIMPVYGFLKDARIDADGTAAKMRGMRSVGVPYTAAQIESSASDERAQAAVIASNLAGQGQAGVAADSEMVALIAYLQRVGKNHTAPGESGAAATATASAEGGAR